MPRETVDASPLSDTLLVAAGGGLGAVVRHGLNVASSGVVFPVGTVVENVTGAFLLGIIVGVVTTLERPSDWLRLGAGVGFCGSYTTMSTFAADTFVTTVHQAPALAAVYVAASLTLGLLMAWAGIKAGESIATKHGGRS